MYSCVNAGSESGYKRKGAVGDLGGQVVAFTCGSEGIAVWYKVRNGSWSNSCKQHRSQPNHKVCDCDQLRTSFLHSQRPHTTLHTPSTSLHLLSYNLVDNPNNLLRSHQWKGALKKTFRGIFDASIFPSAWYAKSNFLHSIYATI